MSADPPNSPIVDARSVAAVVPSLAACYMDLVSELAAAGHLDRAKLASRLENTADALKRDADDGGANLTRLIALGVKADLTKGPNNG